MELTGRPQNAGFTGDPSPGLWVMPTGTSTAGVGTYMGVWNGQVLVLGDTEAGVTTVIDRCDG